MDLRFGIVFLLVVGAAWDCDARNLESFGNSFLLTFSLPDGNLINVSGCCLELAKDMFQFRL